MADYTLERNDHRVRLTLAEKLTAATVPGLQAALKRVIAEGGREIVFDLAATSVLDSTAIGLLIAANNSVAALQGQVRLVNVPANLMKLLQSMRLAERLHASEVDHG